MNLETLAKKALRITTTIIFFVMAILFLKEQYRWAFGFLIGSVWAMFDFWLTINILNISVLKESRQKLFLNLAIKFPVLYGTGFLIIISKKFILYSLLFGVGLVFLMMGVVIALWSRQIKFSQSL